MNGPCFILAVDHRPVMVKACEERGVGLERVREFKALCVDVVLAARQARPRWADQMMLILDDEYGALALERARRLGVAAGRPVEKGGASPFEFAAPDWQTAIVGARPAFIKARFEGSPSQEARVRSDQEDKLVAVSRACQALGVPYMPEALLKPKEGLSDLERARAVALWMRQLRAHGVKARFWKLEGLADPAANAVLAQAALPDEGIVLLGGPEPQEKLREYFRAMKGLPAFQGFAVGRSIFWAAFLEYLGAPDSAAAVGRVLASYLDVIDAWLAIHSAPQ